MLLLIALFLIVAKILGLLVLSWTMLIIVEASLLLFSVLEIFILLKLINKIK